MADHGHVEHKHGSMDTKVQEAAFRGLIKGSMWVITISAVVLIFMALSNA